MANLMKFGDYFYQIVFEDGTVVRRQNMTKNAALAVYNAMNLEMILFKIQSVEWGKM
jgi:hypothetical protein